MAIASLIQMRRRLLPHSLQGRLLLTFLSLNLLSIGGFIAWSAQRVETDTVEQAEHDLEIQSHLISDALREAYELQLRGIIDPAGSLESQVISYAARSGVQVAVINANLQDVVNSSPDEPSGHLEDHPEILAARSGTEQHDIRWNEKNTAMRLYVATAINDAQDKPEGYVQLSTPMAPIYADVRQAQISLLGVGVVVLLITALASLLLARQIAMPVRSLTATTEGIAQGHLEQRVTPQGPDEIQRLGRAFNLMAARVSDMLMRQEEFVANAAHELRSPLTSIRLRLEILQEQAHGDSEMTKRNLSRMDEELARLQRLVDNLLTLSALDQNEPAPRTTIDLAPLLYELVDEMSPLVKEAGVGLQINVPDHLPEMSANAEHIRIAVRNLLDNAVKYTPPHGQVSLTADSANGTIEIRVADTGVGIEDKAIPHIFDRFYRGDKTRSGRRGSGLGLALAKSIAEANGGVIKVASKAGAGSTFTLLLPAETKS
jgi:signal transduction histidine kinase